MKVIRSLFAITALLGLAAGVAGSDGSLVSSYLAGTFDTRTGSTILHIVNPTAKQLEILVAFFDETGNPLGCVKNTIQANGLLTIDSPIQKLPTRYGVVKIVSHIGGIPTPGILGFQRHYFSRSAYAESNLAPIPCCYLWEEFKKIFGSCR